VTSPTTGTLLPNTSAHASTKIITSVPGYSGKLFIRSATTAWTTGPNQITNYPGHAVGDYIFNATASAVVDFGVTSYTAGNLSRITAAATSSAIGSAVLASAIAKDTTGTTFLRDDGTWAVPAGGGGGGSNPNDTTITFQTGGQTFSNNTFTLNQSSPAIINIPAADWSVSSGAGLILNKPTVPTGIPNNATGTNGFFILNRTSSSDATWLHRTVLAANNPGSNGIYVLSRTGDSVATWETRMAVSAANPGSNGNYVLNVSGSSATWAAAPAAVQVLSTTSGNAATVSAANPNNIYYVV